jgi:hypothetical protein
MSYLTTTDRLPQTSDIQQSVIEPDALAKPTYSAVAADNNESDLCYTRWVNIPGPGIFTAVVVQVPLGHRVFPGQSPKRKII